MRTADWRNIYTAYGWTMHEAQSLELAVIGLASANVQAGDDDAWATVEKLFKQPLKQVAQSLGVEEDFADRLQAALKLRNRLAHDYLIIAGIRIHAGAIDEAGIVTWLTEARGLFEQLTAHLNQRHRERLDALGVDPAASQLPDQDFDAVVRRMEGQSHS